MKRLITFLSLMILAQVSFGQLSGTKNIPGDYPTLEDAITALNAQGVGGGGVTINLLASNPQTAPAGGYVIGGTGSLVLTSTNATDQVFIQGNGNTITASAALTIGALNDAIFKIIGGDYITIQGFVMQENAANTVTVAANNNMTEWGVALLYVTMTDGAKNNTIQNNTITLVRTYQNTFGIYSNVRHSPTAISVAADITNVSGANDNTHIYSNNISNVNNGIVIVGSTTGAYMNTGIDIGGTGTGTANTVGNYGITGTFSSYVSVSGSVMGINVNNSLNVNISYNNISCPGLNTAGTVYGIYNHASGTLPTTGGPFTNTLSHNNISVKSGLIAGIIYGLNNAVGNLLITYDVSYNDFNNFGHTVAGTGAINCLYTLGAALVQTINHNTFTNLNVNTTGAVYLLYYGTMAAAGTQTVTYNSIVTGFTKTGAGSTLYCTYDNGGSPAGSTKTVAYNNFSNITLTGSAALVGFQETDGGAPGKSIHDNTLSNVTGGTGAITGLTYNYGTANIYNNTFTNIAGGGAITVMSCGGSSATLQNVYSNMIYGISSSGASAIYGIQSLASGTSAVSNVYKNKVCDISGSHASSIIYGIYISAGTTINTYNNMVSDLRTPAANAAIPLAGIYVSGGTTNNVFNNSVYLAGTSSGALFGSAALYASTSPNLDMRNNILVNATTPVGATGYAAAYRRTGTTLTTYSNNSDANCFWAGTPGTNNLIMYDGTNSYQTMTTYQPAVAPRDAVSFSELPPFFGGSPCYDVHLQTTIATLCESGGLTVTTPFVINDDYDSQSRGSTPDVGADEFTGIAAGVINPGGFTATVMNTQQINLGFSLNPSSDTVVIVWNNTGTFTAPSGPPPVPGSSFAGGTVLSKGLVSPVNHTSLTYNTTYFYKAFSYNGTIYSSGVPTNATTTLAPPTAFTATPFSSTQINLAYTKNAANNDVIIATNSTATFDQPANGTVYPVNTVIGANGTVIYQGPLSAFNHTLLNPSTTYFYKAWSVDTYDYYSATGATANATTFCEPITTYPWNEGFEGVNPVGAGLIPPCMLEIGDWTTYNAPATYNRAPHSGTNYIATAWLADDWLFTPQFSMNGGTSYDFSFWYVTDATGGWDTLQVKYGNSQTVAGMTTNIGVILTNITQTTYVQYVVTFTPALSGNYFIGIRVKEATSTPWYFTFDDLKFEPTAGCPAPTSLKATNITGTTADISWTAGGSETAWEYVYGVSPVPVPTLPGTPTSLDSIPLNGLSANTTYQLYVRADCGVDSSAWVGPHTFVTTQVAATLPFSENFETWPNGWSVVNGTQTNKWAVGSATFYAGAQSAYISEDGGATNTYDSSFVSVVHLYRDIAFTGGGTAGYTLKFWWKGQGEGCCDYLKVYLVAASTVPAAGTQLSTGQVGITYNLQGSWVEATIALSDTLTGKTKRLVLSWRNDGSVGTQPPAAVDDLSITPLYCPAPTALTATNVLTNSADIGWTAGGTETAWEYVYGISPVPAPTVPGTPTTFNPTALDSLIAGTAYQFYVRADCGADSSSWAGPFTFITLCDPYTSLNENFDGVTAPALPNCWAKYTSPSYTSQTVTTYTTGPYSSPNTVRLYSSTATLPADAPMLITPGLSNLGAGTHQLRFFAKGASTNLSVILGTMSDPANSATFAAFDTVTGLNTTTYTECTVSFASYSGTNTYIAFRHPMTTTSSYIYIDNAVWEPVPACPKPTSLTTTNITPTSADLGWTPGGTETNWNVEVGLPGFTPGTNNEVLGVLGTTDNPWNADPLSPATNYEFYVQGNCDAGYSFNNPKIDHFWIGIDENSGLLTEFSGGSYDDEGEDGTWRLYDSAPGDQDWYNIWFYNDTVDTTRVKIIRMGFWIQRSNQDLSAELFYVVNWSTPDWQGTAFPMPENEPFIERSLINGPVNIDPLDPEHPFGQWVELYYLIPDFNPEWVSVDLWGNNITILNDMISPPESSPLRDWWVQNPGPGGIIVHECLPENVSTWSGPKAFATTCGTVTSFTENFDAVTTPALPLCWTKVGTEGSAYTQTSGSYSSPNCMYIYAYTGTYGATVTMPQLSNLGAGSHKLTFKLRANLSVGGVVQVGYMTDPADPATFTLLQSFTTTSTSVYQDCEVIPGTAPGSSTTLAFRQPSSSGLSALVDNVAWEALPTCPPPTTLTVGDITLNSANLSWVPAGSETAWEYVYGPSPLPVPTTPGTPTTSSTVNPIFGLSSNTTYQYYVRADCGAEFSSWAGPETFSTLQVPATLPFSENFEIWPNNWSVVNGTQTNQWVVGTATFYGGAQSAYVSNDGGINNAYTLTSTSVVHMFRDIAFSGGAGGYTLKFWWKGQGEGTTTLYDYLRAFIVDPSTLPVAGTELSSGQVGVTYNLQGTWIEASIALPGSLTGSTKRLVLSWRNDISLGTQPPAAVDNLSVVVSPFVWTGSVSTSWTEPGNWDGNAVPDATSMVIIPADPASDPNRFPVIAAGVTANCYEITLGTGAILTVENGGILNITNP